MIGTIAGYIAKHWRGQLPLAQSFGLGAFAVLPFALWFVLSATAVESHPGADTARLVFTLALPFVLFLLTDIWSAFGIWRCARKYNKFSRPIADWAARTAQAAVVANFVVMLAATVIFGGQLRAFLDRPPPPAPPAYEVTLRGNTAVFQGRMNAAAASELELLLSDKSVKRLAIAHSVQGEIAPALPLVKIIRARKLFVVALEMCDAACTALLTAGDVRAIVPQTVLNFGDAKSEPALRSLITAGIVTTIFDPTTRHYVRASLWCAKNPVACARTGRQNAQARERGDGKDGA